MSAVANPLSNRQTCTCARKHTTNMMRTDTRPQVCAAMVPYRWDTRGTSLRELDYTHTIWPMAIFFLFLCVCVFDCDQNMNTVDCFKLLPNQCDYKHFAKERRQILARHSTLKCLSIATPNTTSFPFVPNGKWWLLGVPIFEHIIIRLVFAQIFGHLKIINFPFGTNGKFIILRCPNTWAHYHIPYQ